MKLIKLEFWFVNNFSKNCIKNYKIKIKYVKNDDFIW